MAVWEHIAAFLWRNMQKQFYLFKVDMKYIRNLHHADDKVLSVSPQTGKDNRVFVGIVVLFNQAKYCIPLSSPKEKHKKMRNSMDFTKIEVDGKLLGVLNYNLMIPVEDDQLQPIDFTVHKRDREQIRHYKELCRREIDWCNTHSEVICNKANTLYRTYVSGQQFKGRERCLDFEKMEAVCRKYNNQSADR